MCFFLIHRLGVYDAAVDFGYTRTKLGKESILLSFFYGGSGGCVGALAASPFFLVNQIRTC